MSSLNSIEMAFGNGVYHGMPKDAAIKPGLMGFPWECQPEVSWKFSMGFPMGFLSSCVHVHSSDEAESLESGDGSIEALE